MVRNEKQIIQLGPRMTTLLNKIFEVVFYEPSKTILKVAPNTTETPKACLKAPRLKENLYVCMEKRFEVFLRVWCLEAANFNPKPHSVCLKTEAFEAERYEWRGGRLALRNLLPGVKREHGEQKYRALHEGFRKSPYEAMFGEEQRFGLADSSLERHNFESQDTIFRIEDLMKILEGMTLEKHREEE
ncbi:hypothetical protein FQR65_LT11707 [Abscondita terminalis]|nr:hypothetical protein FQR65_LT11707 [Abscondita terminalis]